MDSYHLRGEAADIQFSEATPEEVYAWADKAFPVSGLGLYRRNGGGWVHVDCRSVRARWNG